MDTNLASGLLLLVEPDANVAAVVIAALRSQFKVLHAADDVAACALLSVFGTELFVVVIDAELRGSELNGLELIALLQGEPGPHLPPHAQVVEPLPDLPIIVTAEQPVSIEGALVLPRPYAVLRLQALLSQVLLRSAMPPRRVVIVEDDRMVARALARLVTSLGHEARVITDALDLDAELNGEPFAVIADFHLARNGVEILALARDRAPRARRVLISGAGFDIDAVLLASLEPLVLLEKPFSRRHLAAALAR